MKKSFLIITFLLSIFLINPYHANAKRIDEGTDEEKVNFFAKHFNFDNFVLVQSRTSDQYSFISLHDDEVVFSNSNSLSYSATEWKPVNVPSIYKGFNIDSKTLGGMSNEVACDVSKILISSIDILDSSGNVVFAKNYDYKKETGSSTIIDFELPFTREEFLVIPFLICILITMLFFKWCFPMRGIKKI